MLRNYRLRRRLGLLPEPSEKKAVDIGPALRWVRHWRRPPSLAPRGTGLPTSPSSGHRNGAALSETTTRSAEMAAVQKQVEASYTKLNAERRTQASLAEGLK